MRDAAGLRRAVEGCDAVVHLVAIIAGSGEDFDRIMARGTRDLVQAARDAGVSRFVLMSALGTNERTRELVPYYGAKWEMEQEVEGSGLDWTIFRPSFVFGRDGGVLPRFIRQVRLTPFVTPVPGDGRRRLQPIWVDDVAAFFERAVAAPAGDGRIYDLGGPDAPTWDELFGAIQRALGVRRRLLHVPLRLLRPGAAVAELLPDPPVTRDMLRMLELGDNVGDVTPAMERFGIRPISLHEQLLRAL
jgi:NADH dehydrogenase